MPALYLFNRRTILAGDDLQIPSFTSGLLFCTQLFVFLPYLLFYTIELLLLSPNNLYNGNDINKKQNQDADDPDAGYSDVESYHLDRTLDTDDSYESKYNDVPTMQSSECSDSTSGFSDLGFPYLILSYLIGTAAYCTASLWYERRIFQISSLGTPTRNLDLRAPLGQLIETKMTVLAGMNVFLLIYGLVCGVAFISRYIHCFPALWWILLLMLLIFQGLQCLLSVTTLLSLWKTKPTSDEVTASSTLQPETIENFNSSSVYNHQVDHPHNHNNIEMAEEMWRNRFEGCCRALAVSTCFLFGGKSIVSYAAEGEGKHFYGDIARALADYFADFGDEAVGQRGLDVVPSDVALGFVLLRHVQAQRTLLARREALQQVNSFGPRIGSYSDVDAAREGFVSNLSFEKTTLFFRWGNKSMELLNTSVRDSESSVVSTEGPATSQASQSCISDTEQPYETFSRSILSPSNPDDVAFLEEGARFARHQLAIYTWLLYYYMYPITGTCRLMGRSIKAKLQRTNSNAGRQHRRRQTGTSYGPCSLIPDGAGVEGNDEIERGKTEGDSYLGIHEATMLAHAGLDKSDLVYASFEAGFYETPYCIVIDRKWKSVVLSIRGSLTLEDCVVDVLLEPSPLDAIGEKYGFSGTGQYCHGGVVECTRWLHSDLMRHKILDHLLLGEEAEYPNYKLRIVGHSLGAGIAVILSFMMRKTYPSLKCICYSPPGGLLTWNLAKECSEFVNSFVLDSDIVPRLSLDNMERLRDEVLHLIARVKLSKYEISKRMFWHGLCREVAVGDVDYLVQQNEDMLYPHDCIPDSEFMRQLSSFQTKQEERRCGRGVSRSMSLYPPGKLVHLVKTGRSEQCMHGVFSCISCGASNSGSKYTPVRKENDDFNEIVISPTLWSDHFPSRVCLEIEKVARQYGIDTVLGSPPSA